MICIKWHHIISFDTFYKVQDWRKDRTSSETDNGVKMGTGEQSVLGTCDHCVLNTKRVVNKLSYHSFLSLNKSLIQVNSGFCKTSHLLKLHFPSF